MVQKEFLYQSKPSIMSPTPKQALNQSWVDVELSISTKCENVIKHCAFFSCSWFPMGFQYWSIGGLTATMRCFCSSSSLICFKPCLKTLFWSARLLLLLLPNLRKALNDLKWFLKWNYRSSLLKLRRRFSHTCWLRYKTNRSSFTPLHKIIPQPNHQE